MPEEARGGRCSLASDILQLLLAPDLAARLTSSAQGSCGAGDLDVYPCTPS